MDANLKNVGFVVGGLWSLLKYELPPNTSEN